MQQSSSSIGALATALAKAQIELVNPEKSMIATIQSDDKGGAEQIFRYAPLSSGLEILRRLSANMKSPSFRRPPSIKRPELLSSRPPYAIQVENGWARLGRFALSRTWRAPKEWARRSPMLGVMRFSHWRV